MDGRLGHLRIVPRAPEPEAAPAGGPPGGRGGKAPPGSSNGGGGGGGIAGWVIIDDAVVLLDGEPRRVEVAGWRAGRIADGATGPIAVVPDWLCARAQDDGERQLASYIGRGIAHVWLLDPKRRTISVYRLGPTRWTRLAVGRDDMRLLAAPFDDFLLDLASLWDTPS